MKKILIILILISITANLILLTFIFSKSNTNTDTNNVPYPLLSPRIFTNNQNDIIINFTELRNKLKKYTAQIEYPYGLYFEYLPSGISIGINEKESFLSASLLKVPIAIATYEQIEKGKWKPDDYLEVTKEDIDPNFGQLWSKGTGIKIPLIDLISQMLIESDNTAKNVIYSHLPDNGLETVYSYLDIPFEVATSGPIVSSKNYASILKSLYFSTYLNKENSQEILDLLTKSIYKDKIDEQILKNIKVAHKIGVYSKDDSNNSIFTDCGIFYVPHRPYILCQMIREDENGARKHMAEITRIVYDYVVSSNHQKNTK